MADPGIATPVRYWIHYSNLASSFYKQYWAAKKIKDEYEKQILDTLQKNSMSNATIQISDGNLKFANTRVIAPLTFKYLEKSLGEIIKSESQSKQIIDYLKQHREVKQIQEIKRITKN